MKRSFPHTMLLRLLPALFFCLALMGSVASAAPISIALDGVTLTLEQISTDPAMVPVGMLSDREPMALVFGVQGELGLLEQAYSTLFYACAIEADGLLYEPAYLLLPESGEDMAVYQGVAVQGLGYDLFPDKAMLGFSLPASVMPESCILQVRTPERTQYLLLSDLSLDLIPSMEGTEESLP